MRSACGLLTPRPTLTIFAAQAHLRRDPGTFDIVPAPTAGQMKAEGRSVARPVTVRLDAAAVQNGNLPREP
jgi:hypothetical protein